MRSKSSTGHSWRSRHSLASMPALLTSTSTPPSCSAAPSATACAPSTVETSASRPTAVPPALRISSTVRCTRSGSRPQAATAAPSAAKRLAIARPMPLDAPVTIARLPARRPMEPSSGVHATAGPRCFAGPGRCCQDSSIEVTRAESRRTRGRCSRPGSRGWRVPRSRRSRLRASFRPPTRRTRRA